MLIEHDRAALRSGLAADKHPSVLGDRLRRLRSVGYTKAVGSDLAVAVYSITPTRRRRFFWAAWWSGEPVASPFRKPDASGGGARTREQAQREAERIAGRVLTEIDSKWARAFARVLIGEPPFSQREARDPHTHKTLPPPDSRASLPSIWQTLGLPSDATLPEIKRAYRAQALLTHPDRGGSEEAFRKVHAAYEAAVRRRARASKRPKSRASSGGPRQS